MSIHCRNIDRSLNRLRYNGRIVYQKTLVLLVPMTTLVAVVTTLLLWSCTTLQVETVEAPLDLREQAWEEAKRYIGMEYEWGGQDFPERGIDCSGLIVNVYTTVTDGTDYYLQFTDARAVDLHDRYSDPLDTPEIGDLIFMGAESSDDITHVALCEKQETGRVYFIDATSEVVPDTLDGSTTEAGVGYRSYPADDSVIKGYGRLLLDKSTRVSAWGN